MARRLSDKTWVEIKTKYQLGYGLRELAGIFDLSPSTIHSRKEKEGWTQEANAKVIELKQNIAAIEQVFEKEQLPFVQTEINEMLDLQRQVNSIVRRAVKVNELNVAYLESNTLDGPTRIKLTNIAKMSLNDLAGISQNKITIPKDPDEDEKDDSVVRFYLPERE